jgi:hypothetical protein
MASSRGCIRGSEKSDESQAFCLPGVRLLHQECKFRLPEDVTGKVCCIFAGAELIAFRSVALTRSSYLWHASSLIK